MAEGNGRNFRQYCFGISHMSHMHIGLSGRYTIEKRNAAGEVVQTLEFDNLITDAGLERWGTAGVIDRCYLGSGTATPTVTDTAMAAPLGSTTTTTTPPTDVSNNTTRTRTAHNKWRFGPGVCTGSVREVGVGWVGGLWSRALVVDGNGNPQTIEKLADETLDVTYAIQVQHPATDATGVVDVGGVSYSWAARPQQLSSSFSMFSAGWGEWQYPGYASAYSGGLTAVGSGSPSGSLGSSSYTRDAALPYAPGSKQRGLKLVFELNSGNGLIRTIAYAHQTSHPYGVWIQVEFTPPIPKLATQELTISTVLSWGRA